MADYLKRKEIGSSVYCVMYRHVIHENRNDTLVHCRIVFSEVCQWNSEDINEEKRIGREQ